MSVMKENVIVRGSEGYTVKSFLLGHFNPKGVVMPVMW